MEEKRFKEITKSIIDNSFDNLSDEERYKYMEEMSATVGIGFFDLVLIDNTIDYCETYVEKYDKKEIIERIIGQNYVSYEYGIEEISRWVVDDLGYKEIDW